MARQDVEIHRLLDSDVHHRMDGCYVFVVLLSQAWSPPLMEWQHRSASFPIWRVWYDPSPCSRFRDEDRGNAKRHSPKSYCIHGRIDRAFIWNHKQSLSFLACYPVVFPYEVRNIK